MLVFLSCDHWGALCMYEKHIFYFLPCARLSGLFAIFPLVASFIRARCVMSPDQARSGRAVSLEYARISFAKL